MHTKYGFVHVFALLFIFLTLFSTVTPPNIEEFAFLTALSHSQ